MTADTTADPTEERHDGPTPHGGVASVIYYRDADGDPAPKSKAVSAEIHELDVAGGSIYRTLASLTKPHSP